MVYPYREIVYPTDLGIYCLYLYYEPVRSLMIAITNYTKLRNPFLEFLCLYIFLSAKSK